MARAGFVWSGRRFMGAIAAIALVCANGAGSAQQTFRSTSNVVAVDVSVYDKTGRPVTTLTAEDFQIVENGVAQPVQTIYLVSADPSIVKDAPVAGIGTSPVVRRELRNRVLVFVFDLEHLSPDGYKRSRAAVESYLRESPASDVAGVVAGGVMLTNRISADKTSILNAMKSMKSPNPARSGDMRMWPRILDEAEALAIARGHGDATDRAVARACQEQPDDCRGMSGDGIVRQQVEAKARQITDEAKRDSAVTLQTLQTLTNGLGRFPGTKQVLLLSDGFFTGEFETSLRALVEAATRNNVRFSTLDARGLNKDARMQNLMGAAPAAAPGDLSNLSSDDNGDALASLAVDTGGEMVQNHNDLRPGLDMILRTTGTYYVLGYTPNAAADGKFHRIEVRLSTPGYTVRARKGYIAAPAGAAEAAGVTAPARAGADSSANSGTTPNAGAGPVPSNPDSPLPAAPAPAAPSTPAPATTAVPDDSARARARSEASLARLRPASPANGTESARLADAGWEAYSRGDVATAREKFAAAVAAHGTAPWMSYALGMSEFALGHFEASLEAWSRVRAAVPEFMPVYFDIADAWFSLGRGTDALATLRDAARRWPDEPDAQNALGSTLVRRGALDEAIDVFSRIVTARPDDSLGVFNLARGYHLRYIRLQQNVSAARLGGATAIGDDDRKRAVAGYKRYLEMGGPFVDQARSALLAIDWK